MPPDIEEWCYSEVGKGKCLFIDNWGQTGNNILHVHVLYTQ